LITAAASRSDEAAVPWFPICVASFFSRAISPMRRASCNVWVIGFWQKQCLPSFIAITPAGACVWSGVLTVTASMVMPVSSSILR
jgi:hypothetical protein